VPKNFGQLLQLCQTIRQKAPSLVPMSWGVAEVPSTGGQVVGLASGEVYAFAPNWNQRREQGEVTFAGSPGWRNALQRIVDLKNASCFGRSVPSFTVAASASEFAREASVMLMGFDSTKSQIEAANPAMKGKYAIFSIPGRSQKTSRLTLFPATGLAVNVKSQNKEAAKAFVDFVAREKQNRLWASIIGATSAWDFDKGKLDDHHKPLAPLIPKITIAQSSGWPAFAPYIALGAGVQGLFTGQRTIDDILKAADAAWPK
jgi:raffinose/stachyose/melibiose transport system substrate-binding protein